jgi:glycosyltransferase involved in cell wall biosynthesis
MKYDKVYKYSICMCNYNMEDTIERSLLSALKQIDNKFEVVLVDDGSSDNSVKIVKRLQDNYNNLKLVELQRDKKRKLGFTRNIAIEHATGKYVLLHLDCDDIFGEYLKDFVVLFEKIESAVRKNILLSGQHINMANREFLLSCGPYKNIYRGEDRDLWSRLAKVGAYIPFDHVDFVTRIPKPYKKKIFKAVYDTFDHMVNDFRFGTSLKKYYYLEFKKIGYFTFKMSFVRMLMIFPAWIVSLFSEELSAEGAYGGFEEFANYRDNTRGTYIELMNRYGGSLDVSFLSDESKKIYKCIGS